MTFWDGGRWLPERAPVKHRAQRTTADLLATAAIIVVTMAFAVPWLGAVATSASISLSPGSGIPGASVSVSGSDFVPKARVSITWDGVTVVSAVNVSNVGTVKAKFTVPSASAGSHTVDVRSADRKASKSAGTVLASASFTVGSSLSGLTSSPSASPTAGGVADPSASPTPVAVSTPTPSAASSSTAYPTASATATPDATATVTPTPASTSTPAPTPTPTSAGTPTPAPTPTPTPTPTPKPTPTPTPAPTATPTPAPTPTPTPSSPWSVPFLSRPASGPIVISGRSNVTVSGYSFRGTSGPAITIQNSSNVTITANDFSGDVGGIYCLNSTNVTVTWNRFSDIGNGTIGSGHSNFIQFNTCTGGYVAHNKGKGGDTEDMISIYKSGGPDSSHPLVIEYNNFESPLPPDPNAWSSTSGSGTMLGDGGGSHIIARYNTYLNVGQAGIGVASGTDIHVLGNILYGVQRAAANVGIYVWNQYSTACSAIEVSGNRAYWKNASGSWNSFWNGNNCGTVSGTNQWNDTTINPASLAVTL